MENFTKFDQQQWNRVFIRIESAKASLELWILFLMVEISRQITIGYIWFPFEYKTNSMCVLYICINITFVFFLLLYVERMCLSTCEFNKMLVLRSPPTLGRLVDLPLTLRLNGVRYKIISCHNHTHISPFYWIIYSLESYI